MDLRAERTRDNADRVIRELARVAFSNLADVASWGPRGVRLRRSRWLLPDVQAAVQEVSETAKGDRKVRMHAKVPALIELAKHLGLYQPPDPASLEKLLGLLPPELSAAFREMIAAAVAPGPTPGSHLTT
jgi:phage terminase small subunit